jgi:hypothetical protein
MNSKPRLSAVWICSESDPLLQETLQHYLHALAALPSPCELIVVGNGAARQRMGEILPVLEKSTVPCTVVDLLGSQDESSPILAGVHASRGKLVALLPPYLQIDPAELSRMLEKIGEGADYVASWRSPRVDSWVSRLRSATFNRLTRFLTRVPLHDINSGLRLMRREMFEQVPVYGDLHRFLPVLAALQGYRVTEVKTRHLQERAGKGDYRPGIYLRRLLDLLTLFFLFKFTRKPLRFFGLIGSTFLAVGALILVTLCVQRLLGTTALGNRPLLIFGILFFMLGVKLFSLGLLGELIIFTHGKGLSEYRVERVYETCPPKPRWKPRLARPE